MTRIDYVSVYGQLLSLESPRLTWDEQAMLTATVSAGRSSCPRAKNGAVLVRDHRVVATGWNSPPRGMPNCDHPINEPCSQAVHAEEAAIVWAARTGTAVEGSMCYVTSSPCKICARMLIQVGVTKVVFLKSYRDGGGATLLNEAGVEVEQMELWRQIPGYSDYDASSLGRIRSYRAYGGKGRSREPRILVPQVNSHGYLHVVIRDDAGKAKTRTIHQLVLEAFVSPKPEGHDGCHNDGDKKNNALDNLRWDTRSNNHADKLNHGTAQRGERNGFSKLTESDVLQMHRMRAAGHEVRYIASYFAVSRSTVYQILSGERWGHLSGLTVLESAGVEFSRLPIAAELVEELDSPARGEVFCTHEEDTGSNPVMRIIDGIPLAG